MGRCGNPVLDVESNTIVFSPSRSSLNPPTGSGVDILRGPSFSDTGVGGGNVGSGFSSFSSAPLDRFPSACAAGGEVGRLPFTLPLVLATLSPEMCLMALSPEMRLMVVEWLPTLSHWLPFRLELRRFNGELGGSCHFQIASSFAFAALVNGGFTSAARDECAAARRESNRYVQLIVRLILAVEAMVAESSFAAGEGVVQNATKKNDSESRAKMGGFGRVSWANESVKRKRGNSFKGNHTIARKGSGPLPVLCGAASIGVSRHLMGGWGIA